MGIRGQEAGCVCPRWQALAVERSQLCSLGRNGGAAISYLRARAQMSLWLLRECKESKQDQVFQKTEFVPTWHLLTQLSSPLTPLVLARTVCCRHYYHPGFTGEEPWAHRVEQLAQARGVVRWQAALCVALPLSILTQKLKESLGMQFPSRHSFFFFL